MNSKKNPPRFQQRKAVLTEEKLNELKEFGGSLIPHSDYHLILEDMIYMSIRRQDHAYPLFRLQGEILMELAESEKAVSTYKKKLSELTENGTPVEDIKFVKSEMLKYRNLKNALRDIGDGMAWRLLGFDRCVLVHLGIPTSHKPHLSNDGLRSELTELGDIINRNSKVALLNALTHILKRGDITAKLKDDTFELVEVKSSNVKHKRLTRQKNKLKETITFFNEGEKTKDDEVHHILSLPIKPLSYMDFFEQLLIRAEKECTLAEKIENHLAIHITDFLADKMVDPKPSLETLDQILTPWKDKDDLVFSFFSFDRYTHVQNFVPFSIFPIQHKFRAKLMTGSLLVQTRLNISEVLRYIETKGWKVVKGPFELFEESKKEPTKEFSIALLKKGPVTIALPMPIIGRVAEELLSIETICEMLDSIFKNNQTNINTAFYNFEFESKQWD